MSGDEYGYNGMIVPKELRSRVLFLIDAKLRGQERVEARAFVRHPRRTCADMGRVIKRLEDLPDLEKETPTYAKLGADAVRRMRADRAQGAKLRELAAKYQVGFSTAQRICAEEGAA